MYYSIELGRGHPEICHSICGLLFQGFKQYLCLSWKNSGLSLLCFLKKYMALGSFALNHINDLTLSTSMIDYWFYVKTFLHLSKLVLNNLILNLFDYFQNMVKKNSFIFASSLRHLVD